MMTTTPQYDPGLARLVTADTLVPCQRPTRPSLKTSCNFRQQVMLKHPFLSDFHSPAEHLHAGLCEGNIKIRGYVPQPFLVRIRGQYYTPDGYTAYTDGTRLVFELKPRGEFDEDKRIPLEHFFTQHNMVFKVFSNESVYERQMEAENWLEIVRILHMAKNDNTVLAEEHLLDKFNQQESYQLGDIVNAGDRESTYLTEIALFRLLHQHRLKATLADRLLDYDTGISRCD